VKSNAKVFAATWIENRFGVFDASITASQTWKYVPWTSRMLFECVQSLSGPSKQVRRVELRMFSSIAPSSLALPPEMVFQRATGGMPVHITVHRDWLSKLLTYMQQPFTRRKILPLAPSLSLYISATIWLSARAPKSVSVSKLNCPITQKFVNIS